MGKDRSYTLPSNPELEEILSRLADLGSMPNSVLETLADIGIRAREVVLEREADAYKKAQERRKANILGMIRDRTSVLKGTFDDLPSQMFVEVTKASPRGGNTCWNVHITFGGVGKRQGNSQQDYKAYANRVADHQLCLEVQMDDSGQGKCFDSPFTWEEMPQNLNDAIRGQIGAANKK